MKTKLKVILHHNISEEITMKSKHGFLGFLKFAWFKIINFIMNFFYAVGLALITIPKLPILFAKESTSLFKKQSFTINFSKAVPFVLLVTIASAPILLAKTASEGQRLGGRVLGISTDALLDAEQAKHAITEENFSLAQDNFTLALQKLETAQVELDKSSILLESIVKLSPDKYNTENILESAKLLTESGALGSEILNNLTKIKFSPDGITHTDGQNIKETLENLNSNSKKISQNLSKANELMAPLDTSLLPAEYQLPLEASKSLVADFSQLTETLSKATDLFYELLIKDQTFLIVMQNNNELRPTGGFIGTVGQGKLKEGKITSLDIRSVYDFDGQIVNWYTPPIPMQTVNNRLFLRDSNWLAHFPDSASLINYNYERSGGETPDLIIAFTPDLFIQLLELTGPIVLPNYNVTISKENFIEQIQTTTSVEYSKELNQPKQMLADLYPALMQRVGEVTKNDSLSVLNLFLENLASKNIQLYSRDPELQSKILAFNWGGSINETSRDYLEMSFSNLSGTKTDRSLIRSAQLNTSIAEDGSIINELTYKVKNPLPNQAGLGNRSLLRILVPNGSRLISTSNFYSFELPKLDDRSTYLTDDLIATWNNSLKFSDQYQVWEGQESGKDFYAGWVNVDGGSEQTVTITYQLPFKVKDKDRYSLLWQKQSGVLPFEITQKIYFPNRSIIWDNFQNKENLTKNSTQNSLTWSGKLITDNFIGMVLDSKQ